MCKDWLVFPCRHFQTKSSVFVRQQGQARKIFLSSIKSVVPSYLVRTNVIRAGNELTICETYNVPLENYKRVYVVGFGKAVLPMAEEMANILQTNITRCIISAPMGTRDSKNDIIEVYRGARDNIPDEHAAKAAKKIVELLSSTVESDLLFVLISGGGSSLLPYPKPPVTLEEKRMLVKSLFYAGATIQEVNTVRKRLSLVKGGGLVQLCNSKTIICLILSDVLGDPLDVIASGPTVENTDSDDAALLVLEKHFANFRTIPTSILQVLQEPNPRETDFSGVHNFIIGNNRLALAQAQTAATELNFYPVIITSLLTGEARVIGERLALLAHAVGKNTMDVENVEILLKSLPVHEVDENPNVLTEILKELKEAKEQDQNICLLLGGETTVKVLGKGVGGRSQELCLSAACKLHELQPRAFITILSGGTDGVDGPCDMAGAVINSDTIGAALGENIYAHEYLVQNNSYNFFRKVAKGRYHLHCGHTETNVCDIIIILIESRDRHKRASKRF